MKDSTISPLSEGAARIRRGVLWVIFALVLLIPKVNRLRRRQTMWTFIRVIVAFAGAAALVFGVARGHRFILVPFGLLILLVALILNSERPEFSVDERAKELGALIVVEGGTHIDAAGRRKRAKIFVGRDRLWVLDSALQVLFEIPVQQIRTVSVEPAGGDWRFRVDGDGTTAEFLYQGTFAEHLARVADATVRSRFQRELPVLR